MKNLTPNFKRFFFVCFLLCTVLFGCDKPIPIKPFIVIDKESSYLTATYTLVDKNGIQFNISENNTSRNVGDTIK